METRNAGQPRLSTVCAMALSALIVLTACGAGPSAGGATDGNEPGAQSIVPPTTTDLANATYTGILDHPLTLSEGRWEGEPFVEGGASKPSAGLDEHLRLVGDVTGDGRDEAVALLWEHSGGTGTRTHLAVMTRSGDSILNLGTDLVGDRVQIQSGFIVDGEISLAVVQAGPEDAACCPTQKAIIGWRLGDAGLTRSATEIIGTLSLADLHGSQWVLAEIGFDRPVPPTPEVTIEFDGDKVSGVGGCNRYFGTVTDTSPGRLEFSAMGTTMMACPDRVMELERRYLRALADGSSYGFSSGRLVIGSESSDDYVALVFRRGEIERSAEDTSAP